MAKDPTRGPYYNEPVLLWEIRIGDEIISHRVVLSSDPGMRIHNTRYVEKFLKTMIEELSKRGLTPPSTLSTDIQNG